MHPWLRSQRPYVGRTVFLSRLLGLYCVIAAIAPAVRGPAAADMVLTLVRNLAM